MTIQEKIEESRRIFLTDTDEETLKENLEKISEWETAVRTNIAFSQWQESDVSKLLIKEFKLTYKNASLRLAQVRNLTEAERVSLWAVKDACLTVLSLMAKDAKGELESVQKEIEYALNST